MTCIVGIVDKGKVWIGGDSCGGNTKQYSVRVRSDRKVFNNGPFLMGFTTSFRMGQLLMFHKFKSRTISDGRSDYEYLVTDWIDEIRKLFKDKGYLTKDKEVERGGTFLLAYKRQLYTIDSDFQVAINKDGYDAIGCGCEYALGVLHSSKLQARDKIQKALEAASYFSAYVEKPYHIHCIE